MHVCRFKANANNDAQTRSDAVCWVSTPSHTTEQGVRLIEIEIEM
jgi:hypothetical protein